ncbi:MAG: hypothetical protein AAB316_11445, partial [Bacteroidota bacterium]
MRKSTPVKSLCLCLVFCFLFQVAFPVASYALTAGENSPEFASFEPVATTDLVNGFTGDFAYNRPVLSIPGPDGGGYSMSLSYHSGVSSEEEASWVGFGWTLNPGAINRQVQGFPDDFNGTPVIKYNKIRPNWTQSSTFDFNMEYNSLDKEKKGKSDDGGKPAKMFLNKFTKQDPDFKLSPPFGPSQDDDEDRENLFSVSFSNSIRYNNYSGFSIAKSFGAGYKGMASLNVNRAGGQTTLGFSINPMAAFLYYYNRKTRHLRYEAEDKFKMKDAIMDAMGTDQMKQVSKRNLVGAGLGLFSSNYSIKSYNAPPLNYSIAYNAGRSFNFSGSIQLNPAGPIGLQVGLAGNLNAQINVADDTIQAYGFLYNPNYDNFKDNAGKTRKEIKDANGHFPEGDFQLEKATTFDKHDKYLGIPFNNADIYSATGNGVIGGFRFHHPKVGHYYPPFVTNKQDIRQLGVEFGIGQTIQIGFDVGLGFQKTQVSEWQKKDELEFESPGPSAAFLRFTNDKGGELRYSSLDDLQFAIIDKRAPDFSAFDAPSELIADKFGTTSYLEYVKFGSSDPLGTDHDISQQVAQIAVTNQDGGKSIYGLPVFTKDQTELTVELGAGEFHDGDYLAYKNDLHFTDPLKNTTALGRRIETPYVSTYLLTQTQTFDYVDVNQDGPDEADFGGWTKFSYRQAHGNNSSAWYRYRAPYDGLLYDRGRLFDLRDQTGSLSSGLKEVYYLSAIETKTHAAFFITNKTTGAEIRAKVVAMSPGLTPAQLDEIEHNLAGSGQQRMDGLDAAALLTTGEDEAAVAGKKGTAELEKLERIVLYAKSNFLTPIRTTFFEYDYSLCRGIPNTLAPNEDDPASGKLTLKKVWTESGGAWKSRISPYVFHYEYFKDYPAQIIGPGGKYPQLLDLDDDANYYKNLDSKEQNPSYKPDRLDLWGFYQQDGESRFKNMIPWVSQKEPSSGFDPAAWQLKRIILPSGGEIHVQYEQKNYSHVQDKKAMAMVTLKPGGENGYKSDENKYYIDESSIGVQSGDRAAYLAKLDSFFEINDNKLYFRILYAFRDAPPTELSSPTKSLRTSDYITGYTSVNEVNEDADGIYLVLGDKKDNGSGKKDRTLPRYVCYEQCLTAAGGTLHSKSEDWDGYDDEILGEAYGHFNNDGDYDLEAGIKEIRKGRAVPGTFRLFADWVSLQVKNVPRKDACKEFNPALSYFKLPVFHAKRGGGIRVKRLISYDPGVENGAAMVYGSEYLYEMPDGSSSGVATNEPPAGREENPIVEVMARRSPDGKLDVVKKLKKALDVTLNGRDSKTQEGPLGESLYPGAQVVHERVVIKNLHSGKSSTGFMVNQYHTVRDKPSVQVEASEISKDKKTYDKFNLDLPLGLFNYSTHKYWITQGYLFKLNDMHGKPLATATYPGNYDRATFNEALFSSRTEYVYSAPGAKVKTLVYDSDLQQFGIGELSPGTEEDLNLFQACTEDETNDFSLELDLNIALPAAVALGFGLSYTYEQNLLCQHVTSKVLSQTSYLLSTITTADGITQRTDNVAFNRHNGEPVLTLTYDSYESDERQIYAQLTAAAGKHSGKYYALNIPASWVYSALGQKSATAPGNFNQLTASAGSIVTYGSNPLANLTAGSTWDATANKFQNVVSASATVFKHNWFYLNPNQDLLNQEFFTSG